jgi:guanine deaminase
MPPQSALAFKGTICHTPTIGSVEVLQDNLLVVNSTGNITHLGPADTPDAAAALQQVALQPKDIHTLSPTQFLLPGFIDTHCHAPQYAFTGTGTDLALFEWLNTYTFPCEAKFGDRQHAEYVYSRLGPFEFRGSQGP